jgi:deoxycytidylate deaminase
LKLSYPKPFRCQHIAGIWLRNRLISVGFNQRKTHTLQTRFGRNQWSLYLHAEIDAIKNFLKTHKVDELRKVKMFVYRDGFKNSKPCAGCQKAIVNFGIRKVFWT